MSERICGVLAPGFRWEGDSKNELRMESRTSDGRSREEKFAYPCAMAPTINMTKPVATAIATFVSIDKLIIFPSVMRPFEFGRAYGRQAHVHPSISLSIVEIGFLDDSGGSSKARRRRRKVSFRCAPEVGATLVGIEVRSNYYERRSR